MACSSYVIDLRMRGRSKGRRFFVKSFDNYVRDLESAIDIIRARHTDLPIFLLGHSAGGMASCLYALDYGRDIAGLICESFAYKLPVPGFALKAISWLSIIPPGMRVKALSNSDFSRDPAYVEHMNSDALIANERHPAATIAALMRAD